LPNQLGYLIDGEFSLRSRTEGQERGEIRIISDSSKRLLIQIRRFSIPLAEISFNGLQLSYVENQSGKLSCSNNSYLPYFFENYGFKIKAEQLAEIIWRAESFSAAEYRVEVHAPQNFEVGLRPSQLLMKIADQQVFSLRIRSWQNKSNISATTFELGKCP
jgi:hypothetical protein